MQTAKVCTNYSSIITFQNTKCLYERTEDDPTQISLKQQT